MTWQHVKMEWNRVRSVSGDSLEHRSEGLDLDEGKEEQR